MRTIAAVTGSRSDYGVYLPVLRRIREASDLTLYLIVTGAHLSPLHGLTVRLIEEDGFRVDERVEMLLSSDTPAGIAKSTGVAVTGFADLFSRFRPDILLVLGDRFEMYAAVLAALPFMVPVAHIHGGEVTEAAIDDALRHSMTKLSHLHFVATDTYARRVLQLGEEPWRVVVSGAPSLDNLRAFPLLSRQEIEGRFGMKIEGPPLLVTYHPVTLEYERTGWQVGELLAALEETVQPVIFSPPNADTASQTVAEMIRSFVAGNPRAQLAATLGTQAYFSLMQEAAAMVGNSSSGIIEAASFRLPVVNIGNRQRGRVRPANVIDVGYRREEIVAGIRRALSPEFRSSLRRLRNPYGDGHAAERIVEVLRTVPLDERLLTKKFCDSPPPRQAGGRGRGKDAGRRAWSR